MSEKERPDHKEDLGLRLITSTEFIRLNIQ